MTLDITRLVADLRGDQYIDAVRVIAVQARERGGVMRCGGDECTNPAAWIGMQQCGAPGGPVCDLHWQRQREWMAASVNLGQPYCRHCKQDVDASHITVLPLDGPVTGHGGSTGPT
jgi:hypothetical protein